MTGILMHPTKPGGPRRSMSTSRSMLLAAAFGLGLSGLAPVQVSAAATPLSHQTQQIMVDSMPTPSEIAVFASAMPDVSISRAGSDIPARTVAAGIILLLFSGLGALTVSMWRDLGRRVGVR